MKEKKILVVEDSKNIITVLRMCLTKAGYEVKVVSDGVKAVETTFEWEPNLILLDIKLPKMNGFLVCETLKEDETTADIPIVMLSAKSEEEDIKRAHELGAESYLTKPIEPEELLMEIDKYIV